MRVLASFFLVALLSFVTYLSTLAPTITWRNQGVDSGDLATAVAVRGVPHPPGYPTYLLLGQIFKLLPLGDIAYRLNLLSALCAALTAAVLGLIIYKTLSTRGVPSHLEDIQKQSPIYFCACSASLTLAFSSLFWSQAVITEVYTLNTLFVALLFYGALQVRPGTERWLVPALFGLWGLSLGNHLSIVLLLPILFWIKVRWDWTLGVAAALAFGLGLSVYLIIPFRATASPPLNWGMATNWSNFLWLISAEPYHQLPFSLPWRSIPDRLGLELRLLVEAFMGWGFLVGLFGLYQFLKADRGLAYISLLIFLLNSSYAIGYNTTDSYIYLLPAFFIFSWWIGWGLYKLGCEGAELLTSKTQFSHGISWGIMLLPLLSLFLNFSSQNLSQDGEVYHYTQQSLQLVAPEAIIITDDDARTFALWYGRYGLTLRPDVAIVNSNLLTYAWYRQTLHQTHPHLLLMDQKGQPLTTLSKFIALNLAHSPLYLATTQTLSLAGYKLESSGPLQRVVELDQ